MRECKTCGKITESDRHTFCSKKCNFNFHYTTTNCKTCGKEMLSKKRKLKQYCSHHCQVNNKDVISKMKESRKKTFVKKYGVESFTQSDVFKKKTKKTNLKRYGVEYPQQNKVIRQKSIETNLNKYGVDNPAKNEFILEKTRQTNLKKYGEEYIQQTNEFKIHSKKIKKQRYGDENYNNLEKYKQTMLSTYGVDNISKTDFIKEKITKEHLIKSYNDLIENPLILEKVNIKFNVTDYKGVRGMTYNFQCKKCNEHFEDRLSGGHLPRCPVCYPYVASKPELEVLNYIKSLIPNEEILTNTRKTLNNEFELDIYIPSRKLAIEYNGLYWHSEVGGGKDKNYHLNKTMVCKGKGIRLIHIFENDWIDRQDIIKSILCNLLNVNMTSIYARKCEVVELNNKEKDVFISSNHIQGSDKSSIRIGLKYNGEIVSVMTFTKSRFDKKVEYEMSRYCNKIFTNVVGGASRLFKYFISKYQPKSIVSYCDRKMFNGTVYDTLGFRFDSNTSPNYYYTDYTITLNRMRFQKHKLPKILEVFDINLSEWENMKINGYDRIWDCGNLKFVWEKGL